MIKIFTQKQIDINIHKDKLIKIFYKTLLTKLIAIDQSGKIDNFNMPNFIKTKNKLNLHLPNTCNGLQKRLEGSPQCSYIE